MSELFREVDNVMSKKGIWFELYGTQSDDFIWGVIAGVKMYAVWKNGKQVVGIMQTPLETVEAEIKEQLGYDKLSVVDIWVKDNEEVNDGIKTNSADKSG